MTTQTRYGNGGAHGHRLSLPTEPIDKAFGLPGLGALKTSARTVGVGHTANAVSSILKPKIASGLQTATKTPLRTAGTLGATALTANLSGRRSGRNQVYNGLAKAMKPPDIFAAPVRNAVKDDYARRVGAFSRTRRIKAENQARGINAERSRNAPKRPDPTWVSDPGHHAGGMYSKADVAKIDIARAAKLQASFKAKGKTAEARRAYQVAARADRGPEEQRRLMAARSRLDIEGSPRGGVHRAGKRRGIYLVDALPIGRPVVPWDNMGNPMKLKKAYQPEARRQRRLGAYEAGLGLGGVYVGAKGVKGVRETSRATRKITGVTGAKATHDSTNLIRNAIRDKAVVVRPKNAAQIAGGAALLGGAGLVRQHAEGKHGRAWN